MLETRLLHLRSNFLQNFKMRELLLDDGEPAEPIARLFPSRARRPFAKDGLLYYFFSSPRCMRQPHLQAGWVTCRSGGLGSRGETCSLAHGIQKRFESLRKELDPVDHQLVRHFFHGDSGFRQIGHGLPGAFHVFGEAGANLSVIAEGIKCRGRNGIHRIGANELFHVNHVAVLWILGAGAGPQKTLRLRALGRQGFPTRATEEFLIFLVSEASVGNRHFSLETLKESLLRLVRRGLYFFIEFAVHEGVNAAHEEACHTRNMADVLTFRGAGLESGKERFGNLFIRGLREQQGDIDVDAIFKSLAYGREAFGCAGDLDHDVRAIHGLPQSASLRERSLSIESKKRG